MDEDSLKEIHIGILHMMLIEKTKELNNLKSKKDKAELDAGQKKLNYSKK
jgi:hypothetical protein